MANQKKEPTEKYVVIKPHTLDHKVGDKIDLTAKQAKNLVGKVRKASDVAGENEAKASPAELKKLKAAEDRVAELEAENEELKKQLEEAAKA